ncbi:hypothetical protein CHARACLAT_017397 [Characodon lateralis]|uniref:Uncharacterized protein n=1 Tax=Characodon lateralis TaxID=208331 RepID=A0ABU7DJW2_9TELE|nr:hypothetical protein [Characodon lateralis]
MKVIIMTFCLIGAAFANPILHNSLISTESESNSTESWSVLESSENNTSELQSSEENTSNQSSESESAESTSEDKVCALIIHIYCLLTIESSISCITDDIY